jgi:hypothetical protein
VYEIDLVPRSVDRGREKVGSEERSHIVAINVAQPPAPRHAITLPYYTLRTVTSPEDTAASRRRYEGVASAEAFFHIASAGT